MLDDKLKGTLGSVLLTNHHSDDQIKNEIGGGTWHVWGKKSCKQSFGGKSEGKRPLGRPSCEWQNIKIERLKVGWRVWTCLICLRIRTGGELL